MKDACLSILYVLYLVLSPLYFSSWDMFLLFWLYEPYSSLQKTKGTRNCRLREEQVYLYILSLQYAIVEHFEGEVLLEIHEFITAKLMSVVLTSFCFLQYIYSCEGTAVGCWQDEGMLRHDHVWYLALSWKLLLLRMA